MNAIIELQEQVEAAVSLTEAEALFLSDRLGRRFAISRRPGEHVYRINPRQFVGIVQLPSERVIKVKPKVPISSLFTMLAWAFHLPDREVETAHLQSLDDLFEFIAEYFVDSVAGMIDGGLYREYIEREDNLFALRGRMDFAADTRLNSVLKHRIFCRFSDLTWDVPHNQVIRYVAFLLSGWEFSQPLRTRLLTLDIALSEISHVVFKSHTIDRFTYNRLNEQYRPIHNLCRLFLDYASLAEEAGEFEFNSFLINMDSLFEKFVTEVFRAYLPSGIELRDQVEVFLDVDDRVRIRPDIRLDNVAGPFLVADCKYSQLEEDHYEHHHLYQVLAYCEALGVRQGLLIYPHHARFGDSEIIIRNSGVNIRQISIDLNWIQNDVSEQLRRLVSGCLVSNSAATPVCVLP